MTLTRSRLVILRGASVPDSRTLEALRSVFDLVEVEDVAAARALLQQTDAGPVYCLLEQLPDDVDNIPPHGAATILQHVGEGVGVVNQTGKLTWANAKLKRLQDDVREQFIESCREALESFQQPQAGENGEDIDHHDRRRRFEIQSEKAWYEVIVSPAVSARKERRPVTSVVGVLWDVTESRQIQAKLDAIDAAGSELVKIESAEIARMNMAERLKWLEEKIVHYVHDLLHFDNFEIRLLNKETNQIELVIAVGIEPLKIGEVIYARKEGNGISGYVAATGESYICDDVRKDPLYREGLDNARSSLTVPLFLHDEVIGVFNVESYKPKMFDETDRRFAEIFGRYIALAMNILDLMLVERYTTNEQVARNVLQELDEPLDSIDDHTRALLERVQSDESLRAELGDILEATSRIRDRVTSCTSGPKTILGAEQELRKMEVDPLLKGKRVLVADDEENIRETISAILAQKGCDVTTCSNGGKTIEQLERAKAGGGGFDLVISDIKMPDRNGYEVFRSAKNLNPNLPVILMTGFGYDPHHSIVRSSQEGLDTFLFKPFQARQLLEAVGRAITEPANSK
jgi:two-component system, sensor histidine kinase SagS